MWLENSIYEAGSFKSMRDYQKRFVIDFMAKPKDWPVPYEQFPIPDGMNDVEYDNIKDAEENPTRQEYVKKYNLAFAKAARDRRTPLLVCYEIEPGFYSLNMASNPNSIACQIDHNDKLFRHSEVDSDEALTVRTLAAKLFQQNYMFGYDKKKSVSLSRTQRNAQRGAYNVSTELVTKDFANVKYLTKLDITNFFRAI